MRKSGILENLAAIEATGKPFISVYLNAEANENGRDDFNAFLDKQISNHQKMYEADSAERTSFDQSIEKINEYVNRIPASANGVAIFACADNDFFETYEFDVSFSKDIFYVSNKPHLYPLARMIDQNPEFAVVLADSNAANIYVMQRGKILNREEIDSEKYSRSEAGGWSQMRFQRHIDEMRKQHAKEVIDELETIVREEDIRQIVIAGNKDVVVPLLLDEMDDFLNERLAGTTRLEIEANQDEIMDAAETVIKQYDTLKDKEKIDELNEQNYAEGKGVTGVANTLKALANGQVQELYITADFDELEYDKDKVKEILKNYAPGETGEMPSVGDAKQIADELITRALDSAERVRFIEDKYLLEEAGGVGALLRFTMSANQN